MNNLKRTLEVPIDVSYIKSSASMTDLKLI